MISSPSLSFCSNNFDFFCLLVVVPLESGPFGPIDRVPLPDISARVLEIICEYLCERRMRGVYLSSFEPLLKLDPTKEGDRELAIELLLAANYMDC